ncbi:MAG TPA: DUF1080 domain-containing protein [Tepidisphaeraceae bacterium]|nr:DUF1080 domain-containing protein [Tepidisphaeraceae bacterium]
MPRPHSPSPHPLISPPLLFLLLLAAPTGAVEPDKDGFVPLFNGTDLSGWVPCNIATGTKAPLVDTFTVKDGMIVCTGVPTGVLRTPRMYENFVVELEWRHMVPKGNSGFFLWADDITSRGVPFSRGLEVQILDGPNHPERSYTTHGDVFPIHGATAKPSNPGKWGSRSYPTEDRSKPSPEWNHYRIEANNGTVTLAVNGKVVNSTSDVSPRKGYLCLESEGGVVHFRNLRIKELPPSTDLDPKHVAIADRGFKTLYNGLSLDGWDVSDAARLAWTAKDWTLKFDASKFPTPDNAIDYTIRTAGQYQTFTLVFDVKSDAPVDLLIPGVEKPVRVPGPEAAKPDAKPKAKPGWRRIVVVREQGSVAIGEDNPLQKMFGPQAVAGSIGIVPTGPADFANLYVSPTLKAPVAAP